MAPTCTRGMLLSLLVAAAISSSFVACRTAPRGAATSLADTSNSSRQVAESEFERRDASPVRLAYDATQAASFEATSAEAKLVSHQPIDTDSAPIPPQTGSPEEIEPSTSPVFQSLEELEEQALMDNPTLRRLQQEAAAEWARVGYVAKLPDPTVSTMVFVPPMHYDPDRQLADLQVMQMIPWLGRLKAEVRRAHLEALAAETLYHAERLRVLGELRSNWYRLYVLNKQVETTEADKAQLQSLIKTANARVRTGDAQPGDVLMATLELSSLEEQLIGFRQQMISTTAEINRLSGRDVRVPIEPPKTLDAEFPDWNYDLLRDMAMESQPDLVAARLRTAATSWGIEVARLKRRPDLTFGAGWMIMDAPGAVMPNAGMDSWTIGVTASIPLWHRAYDAMVSEATREHCAAHASEDEVALRLEALLRDLWEQAVASHRTIQLYETTILPQARQTFEADQKSLTNNAVSFDRVVRDYRTLLNLQLGYHRALGQQATTLARIRQAVGVELMSRPDASGL